MNYIWVGLVVIAVIFGAITGNLSAVQGAIFDFAMTAVEIVFELIGILCFFSGLMAVAEKRAGLKLSVFDAYINVIGGLQLDEPGADLPVALALASSYRDKVVDNQLVAIGEVGLTGEIRSVSYMNQRLAEVARLGFQRCIIPKNSAEKLEIPNGLTVYRVKNLREAIEVALCE